MLLQFTFPRSATHAEILQGASERRKLMSLEVGQDDQAVGIMNICGYVRNLDVAASDRYSNSVVATQPVRDDRRGSRDLPGEAVVKSRR